MLTMLRQIRVVVARWFPFANTVMTVYSSPTCQPAQTVDLHGRLVCCVS
jgi:hypothetical protein